MTKIGFISLGCPKNQIDTEVMLHELVENGYELVADEIDADIIIVNTCAFIESAKQESIDNILDVAWLKENRNLKGIIVCGCLAERYRNEIFDSMPEVDALVGTGSIHKIVEAVKAIEAGDKQKYSSFDDMKVLDLGGDRVVTTPTHFAYLKIAEGCDNRCTYCAIPSIRGGFRSRTEEDIVAEAKTLEELGVKELILIAQDTTRYGFDLYGEYRLARLIRQITKETKIPWIRLLYCYPDKITDELVNEIKCNPRVVKYIDLPIQHISDSVLRRMNRHGESAVIKDAISRLRRAVPDIIIRSTVICGFPGETQEEFNELCEFIKEVKIERLGAFAYSREEGTPAYDFEGQIDGETKQQRADAVMKLQMFISEEFNKTKLGKELTVICEGYDPVSESYFGRSYMDAPEIDGKIFFTADKKIPEGKFVNVIITDILDYDLIGEIK